MRHDIDWSKSHCGVFLARRQQMDELMPEVIPILDDLAWWVPEQEMNFWHGKLLDVKVHMLMPGQYPCIPGWHRDFTPRGEDGERLTGWTPPADDAPMFMWLSGAPLTQYRRRVSLPTPGDHRVVYTKSAQQWHEFYRRDVHRGQVATEHTWRCFIRVIPEEFVHSGTRGGGVRRHSQVYLDAGKFSW